MIRFTDFGKILFRVVLIFVMLTCPVTVAENEETELANKEVLTTLEQRMLKEISIDFRNTPVEDVIRVMAAQADVDIVKSPRVVGNVTATLTNVPLEEALSNILAAHNYGYVADKNMIRIAPIEEITQRAESIISRIYRITYAEIKEVEKSLNKFISKRGSVAANPGTSNIIVSDTESKIKAIDTFIEEIDRITPQILVEARIYDITSKDSLDLGIQWNAGRNTTYEDGLPTGGRTDPFITTGFDGTIAKTADTTAGVRFGWLNDSIDIDFLLKAQKENIDAKLLANPRILVLDNESAVIKIISEIPYVELTETSDGGSMGTTAFREVGVTLAVIPHITRDEMVRLQLKPVFSVVTGAVDVGSGSQYAQPVVDKREADTILLIKNGQTVVLGGMRKRTATQQINKVPLLGDMPVLGALFKFKGEETVTSELVVFVTPRIVEQPGMSEIEAKHFEVTNFEGPVVIPTKAEKAADATEE